MSFFENLKNKNESVQQFPAINPPDLNNKNDRNNIPNPPPATTPSASKSNADSLTLLFARALEAAAKVLREG